MLLWANGYEIKSTYYTMYEYIQKYCCQRCDATYINIYIYIYIHERYSRFEQSLFLAISWINSLTHALIRYENLFFCRSLFRPKTCAPFSTEIVLLVTMHSIMTNNNCNRFVKQEQQYVEGIVAECVK